MQKVDHFERAWLRFQSNDFGATATERGNTIAHMGTDIKSNITGFEKLTIELIHRAVMGAIRSASLEDSPLLGQPAFEEELVRMLWGVLRADG